MAKRFSFCVFWKEKEKVETEQKLNNLFMVLHISSFSTRKTLSLRVISFLFFYYSAKLKRITSSF